MQLVKNILKDKVEFNFSNNTNLISGVKDFLKAFAEKLLFEKFTHNIDTDRLQLLYADSLKIFFSRYNDQYYFVFLKSDVCENKVDFEVLNYDEDKTLITQEIECELNNGEVVWGFSIGRFEIYNQEEIPKKIAKQYLESHKLLD